MKRQSLAIAMALSVVCVVPVSADLVFIGAVDASGGGIGTVNTILTVQDTPVESGCVGWTGGADIIGPFACPAGVPGGDEQTGLSQTQTRSIAELGLPNAQSIAVFLNAVQTSGGPITVEQLVLRIYEATTGVVLFEGRLAAPIFIPQTFEGTGGFGFGFGLDAAQAALAQAAFANPNNRIGLASTLSLTDSGAEVFFILNRGLLGPVPGPVPTMPEYMLLLLALAMAALGYRMLRQRSEAY